MKYVVCVPDGAADEPLAELGGRTPLAAAKLPTFAALARRGEVGRAATIPDGFPPGSDVGNLSILGYDPAVYHTGRAPIEAAAMGLRLADDEVAYRCNLVTVGADGTMVDFAGGHPSTEAARDVVEALGKELGGDGVEFHAGVQYRHILVAPAEWEDARCTPPHDLTGKPAVWPTGPAAPHLQRLMDVSRAVVARFAGQVDANQIWLWGQGRQPRIPSFADMYGLQAGLVSAVDLVRGLGVLTGIRVAQVEGITGWYDTNYEAKRDVCLRSLADGDDLFLIHVEASDEAGHAGNVEEKVKALENWDRRILAPLVDALDMDDFRPWRLLLLPDHATPLALRTHTSSSVPYLLVDSEVDGAGGVYTEAATADCTPVPGHTLMNHLITQGPEIPVRVLVLVDGEHYPPVVRSAIEHLPTLVPGADVVGAALLGGGEKLAGPLEIGVPVVEAATAAEALARALDRFRPELVFDLSDEPVVDARSRLRLAAQALLAGVPYQGADFRLDPPPRPRVATKPTVAVIGTGKRTGKTAVSADLARTLAAAGRPPVVVAMGRGGPPEPELIDPSTFDLTPAGLVALAAQGRHAASDHLEDALMARVVTIGTRRCGGGLAGAPVDSTFAAGVALANARPERLIVLEGSGAAIPPVHADVTICVVPATADPELVGGYLGAYRLLLADLVVLTMAERREAGQPGLAGACAALDAIRRLAPEVAVAMTVLRPAPLVPVAGRRVFYVTTAPRAAGAVLVAHLEAEHGCTVVGTSHNLARRPELAADLDGMDGAPDVLLVELKAAGVDLAAKFGLERHMDVVFCDNRVVTVGGDGSFEDFAMRTADLAEERYP